MSGTPRFADLVHEQRTTYEELEWGEYHCFLSLLKRDLSSILHDLLPLLGQSLELGAGKPRGDVSHCRQNLSVLKL